MNLSNFFCSRWFLCTLLYEVPTLLAIPHSYRPVATLLKDVCPCVSPQCSFVVTNVTVVLPRPVFNEQLWISEGRHKLKRVQKRWCRIHCFTASKGGRNQVDVTQSSIKLLYRKLWWLFLKNKKCLYPGKFFQRSLWPIFWFPDAPGVLGKECATSQSELRLL